MITESTLKISGLHARQCLDTENRSALYSVVPNSLVKTQLMELHQKFDLVRKIYTRRYITQEERNSAILLCEDLKECFEKNFPYVKVTATMHLVMDHVSNPGIHLSHLCTSDP